MGIRIFDLLLDILGSIQDTMIGDIISMTPPNGLTAAMGGRAIDREDILEGKAVEEMVVIVGGAGKKD